MSKYNEIIAVDDMAQGTFEEREKKKPYFFFFPRAWDLPQVPFAQITLANPNLGNVHQSELL